MNDLFRLANIGGATYLVLAGTSAPSVRTVAVQPDKMSDDESGGNQKGSDERAGTSFQRDGHAAL